MTDRFCEKLNAEQLKNDLVFILKNDIGVSDSVADMFAIAIADRLGSRWIYLPPEDTVGRWIYFPAKNNSERDQQIRREFNGRNRYEVMKKYNISKSRLYQIAALK